MYRTGKYTFQQIADMKSLSKSTVINIIKGYPYNKKDKDRRYSKLQVETSEKLKEAITEAENRARKAYLKKDLQAYGDNIQRWMSLMQTFSDGTAAVYEKLQAERLQCEQRAWEAFADGNYSYFGYLAATWDTLTNAIGDNLKNPWKTVAAKINSRGKSHNVKYMPVFNKEEKEIVNMFTIKPERQFTKVSDDLWEFIERFLPGKNTRYKRDIFNKVLYAISSLKSFRAVSKHHTTLYKYYCIWYRTDFFGTLLDMSGAWEELEAIRLQLLEIEKHRLLHGVKVMPKISEIRRLLYMEVDKDAYAENGQDETENTKMS
jgi:hypothetical protein